MHHGLENMVVYDPGNFVSDLLSRDRTPFRLHHTNINVKKKKQKKTTSTGMATQMQIEVFWREIA